MSDVVVVEYDLTPEDWVSAVVTYARDSKLIRRSLRTTRLVFGITVAALVLMLLWGGTLTAAAFLAVLGAAWVAVVPAVARANHRRHLRRMVDDGLANGTFGRHRVVLTDEGILDSADGYDLLIHWGAVERVKEGDGALLIYNGTNSFFALPTRAFPDRATFEAFSARFFRGLEEAGRLGTLEEEDEEDLLAG